jgi:hypothetical protein
MNNTYKTENGKDRILEFWRGKTTDEILLLLGEKSEVVFSQEAKKAIESVLLERNITLYCPVCKQPYKPFESACMNCGRNLSSESGSVPPKKSSGDDEPLRRSSYWAGLIISALLLTLSSFIIALALHFSPLMDVFQIVGRTEYDQKVTEATDLAAKVTTLKSSLVTAENSVETLNDQLADANAEILRLTSEVKLTEKYKSLICLESWAKLNSSTIWYFKEPYYSFMGTLGFQAKVTQWNTSKTLSGSNYTVLLADLYKTRSMVLNIDEDCVIVNPAWKTF